MGLQGSRNGDQYEAQANGKITIFDFGGPLSFGAAADVGHQVRERVKDKAAALILDFSQVPFVDVSAARAVETIICDAKLAGKVVYETGMNDDDLTPDTVSLVDLIERLAEPQEPLAVSMTPQTAGWTVMAFTLVVLAASFSWRWYRRWRANAYRRSALADLSACGDDPVEIATILRCTALAAWPREDVASLTGTDWLEFLDRTGGDGEFGEGIGKIILSAPYQSQPEASAPDLHALASRWIRQHKVSKVGAAF